MTSRLTLRAIGFLVAAPLLAAALAGCAAKDTGGSPAQNRTEEDGGGGARVRYLQAGSSTVLPVAQAWAEEFSAANRNVELVVSGGGTGAGFKQFCRGEIQISDASRPIRDSETRDCLANGVDPFEVQVAIDGLAVTVSNGNRFVNNLTVGELNRIWTANTSKQANRWSDLRADWPSERIVLYGPGTDSGTFDYFVEVIIHPFDGTQSKGRSDYTPSEDDNVLVQGVAASPYALGYFGLAYVEENTNRIKAVPVDNQKGTGAVAPTAQTVEAGLYQPLARPIFMYTDGRPQGELRRYFEFGLGPDGQALVDEVGYIKLPDAKRAEMVAKVRGA